MQGAVWRDEETKRPQEKQYPLLAFNVDTTVLLVGLQSDAGKQLNGRVGVVRTAPEGVEQRQGVRVAGRTHPVAIQPKNMIAWAFRQQDPTQPTLFPRAEATSETDMESMYQAVRELGRE